jgi:HK97 gp10 family phage protein
MSLASRIGTQLGLTSSTISTRSRTARGRKNDPVQITWVGIIQIERKLAKLGDGMRKKALRPATRQVAHFTRNLAMDYAPHDTGQLERAIKVRAAKRSRAEAKKHQVATNTNTAEDLFQGDEFYAGFMEFGTEDRVTAKGANRGKIEEGRFDFLRRALYLFPEKKRQIFIAALAKWMREQRAKGKL